MSKIPDDRDKLELYIENLKKQSEELPQLQRMLDIVDLNLELDRKFPGQSSPIDLQNSLINQGLQLFSNSVGDVQPYTGSFAEDCLTSSLSGATGSFNSIRTYSPANPDEKVWKTNSYKSFEKHIKRWDSTDSIRSFLEESDAGFLHTEFQEFLDSRESFRAKLTDHSSFGIKTRNFLEHFKGLMKKAAQIANGETPSKRNLSWPKIGQSIVTNPNSSSQLASFKGLGDKWTSAHSDLSEILKKADFEAHEELVRLGDQVILLIESFCKLISKEKIKNAT